MKTLSKFLWLLWLFPIFGFAGTVISMSGFDRALEWFGREGHHVMLWWLIVSMAGWAAFPLMFRLLPSLADRGYGLSRLAGVILTAFLLWFLTSLGLLQNSPAAITTAWILLLIASLLAWLNWENHNVGADLKQWFNREWPLVLMVEIVFLVALVTWAFLRAHNPELYLTEKPMELAFINGVRNSASFPPKDPWLAGYGISYYYFGYVIVASLADLSNIPSTLAFNLSISLIFALVVTGALSIGYNLVRSSGALNRWKSGGYSGAIGTGLLSAFFIALMGNFGPMLIELPYAGFAEGIPVVDQIVSEEYFNFFDTRETTPAFYREVLVDGQIRYELSDRDELSDVLPVGYRALPDYDRDGIPNWDDPPEDQKLTDHGFNWWHHSRMVRDVNLADVEFGEPITEFPAFSFLLADNHPHVLGLPFTLLMIGLTLALVLRADALPPWGVLVYGIIAGGMIFLNAWDAIYVVILVAAEATRRLLRNGTGQLSGLDDLVQVITGQKRLENNLFFAGPVFIGVWLLIILTNTADINLYFLIDILFQTLLAAAITFPVMLAVNWLAMDTDWSGIGRFAIWLGLIFGVAYYPWIESFSSQANGFYPNILFSTRSPQFFIQFGIFLILLLPFIAVYVLNNHRRINWGAVATIVIVGLLFLLLIPMLSAAVIDARCPIDSGALTSAQLNEPACAARRPLFGEISNSGLGIVGEVFVRRLQAVPTQALMLFVLAVATMRLFPKVPRLNESNRDVYNFSPSIAALFLFLAAGATAALLPDLLYLRDNFDTRMNTIFKLYYQTWTLLSVSTAFIVYLTFAGMFKRYTDADDSTEKIATLSSRFVYGVVLTGLLAAGSLYPVLGLRQHYLVNTGRLSARTCTSDFCQPERDITLDGAETLINQRRDFVSRGGQARVWGIDQNEFDVMNCLLDLEDNKNDAVLIEAAGGGYDPQMGRFAMYTGIPTLLGWDNHERQWRGTEGFSLLVSESGRWQDIHRIYEMPAESWQFEGQEIIDRYSIDYVVVGQAERNVYTDAAGDTLQGLEKFEILFDPVCQQGDTAVYRVSAE